MGAAVLNARITSTIRTSDSEFDEYRQLQERRLSDLKDDLDSVSRRLEKVAEEVEHSDSHQQRVEALQKREELQAEKEDLENKQAEILRKKQTGFEERRREIYNRHSLKIVTAPVVGTVVSYERGEITFQLESERSSDSLQVPYAAGVGTTDNASCNHCQASLSTENHIVIADGIKCRSCSQN
jgi:DNA repair exonuclease SbcCD ATPase subunit